MKVACRPGGRDLLRHRRGVLEIHEVRYALGRPGSWPRVIRVCA